VRTLGQGVRFGRYRLIERIGQGGMADVYRGIVDGPQGFTRQVAIKRIHKMFAGEADFVPMLATEARVTALLNHPSIVQVYEYGSVDGEHYLAMELADGPDLNLILRTAHQRGVLMPPDVVCYLIGQVADALAYAHALCDTDGQPLAIVHRDVSPSNIIVTHVGAVKLLDFGIAKAVERLRGAETVGGRIKGKASYLAPEQFEGARLDHRCDQFALGIVFWEALTAQRLFTTIVRPPEVTPPSHVVAGLDPEIDAIVVKMLARAARDRFADCAEVARVLAPVTRRLHGDALALKEWLAATGPFVSSVDPRVDEALASEASPQVTVLRPPPASLYSTGELQPSRTKSGGGLGWFWLAVVASAALSAVAGFELLPQPPAPAHVAPTSAAPLAVVKTPVGAAVAPAPVAPAPVQLRVEGTPGAQVVVDGKTVGRAPLELSLPSAQKRRRIAVVLEGHQSWTRDVAGDVDILLVAALLPTPTLALPPAPVPAPPPPVKPTTRPAHPSSRTQSPGRVEPIVRDPFR
jgi:serine/threonine-protein kinase